MPIPYRSEVRFGDPDHFSAWKEAAQADAGNARHPIGLLMLQTNAEKLAKGIKCGQRFPRQWARGKRTKIIEEAENRYTKKLRAKLRRCPTENVVA